MSWINAALAFALSMILFSTIVSAATETVHRLLGLRKQGLLLMLTRLFDKVVWPRMGAVLVARGEAMDEVRADFLEVLRRNWSVDELGGAGRVGAWFVARHLDSLDAVEFSQRLADTRVGRAIAEQGSAVAEAEIGDLLRRYERLGADASAYFRQRARMLSIVTGVLVAFALNVDAVRLFSVFASSPELAARLLERQDEIVAAADAGPGAGAADPADAAALEASLRASAARALDFGLPIGTDYFPWCRSDVDPACRRADAPRHVLVAAYVGWLVSVAIAGVLMGQGAPFWFSVLSRLSTSAELLRGLGIGASRRREGAAGTAAAGASGTPAASAAAIPADPVEAFRVTVRSARPRSPAARVMLSRDGRHRGGDAARAGGVGR